MKTTIKIILLVGVPFLLLWAATSPYGGWLPESKFKLSQDSRLPKWFILPPGYNRKDLTVTIDLYAPLLSWNNNFRAILRGPGPEYRQLDKKTGMNRPHPTTDRIYQEKRTHEMYPNYSINTVNGIQEIFEQRESSNILYISDDPALKKAIEKN